MACQSLSWAETTLECKLAKKNAWIWFLSVSQVRVFVLFRNTCCKKKYKYCIFVSKIQIMLISSTTLLLLLSFIHFGEALSCLPCKEVKCEETPSCCKSGFYTKALEKMQNLNVVFDWQNLSLQHYTLRPAVQSVTLLYYAVLLPIIRCYSVLWQLQSFAASTWRRSSFIQ